ncbi:MAG: NUDIX hydrolase, partial [Chloroflexi bacterium]|nr:NUDIX hydrolase [Chloroflexota bacterium]
PRSGEWSIPGGAVEVGETLQEATRREVREECGIEIDVGEVIEALDIIQRDEAGRVQFHYVIVDFAATYRRGALCATSDAADARWVALGDLDQYPMNAKTREVILKRLAKT